MALDPYLNTVVIGPITLPPPGLSGHAWLKVSPGMKVDEKSSTGKDGNRITLQGRDNAEVSLMCQINDSRPAAMRLLAGTVNELLDLMEKGPAAVSHINAEATKIGSVQLLKLADGIVPSGGKLTITLTGKGWSADSAKTKSCQLYLLKGSTDKSTSGEVTKWQTFLTAQGYYTGPINGLFGTADDTATRAFQTATGAQVDGIVGPETFGKAAALGYTLPTPKTCGSVTKTPTKAESDAWYGAQADKAAAKAASDAWYADQADKAARNAARAAAIEEMQRNGVAPNERGEGLPEDYNWDPYADAYNEGGAP